jgi:hypothetical protein
LWLLILKDLFYTKIEVHRTAYYLIWNLISDIWENVSLKGLTEEKWYDLGILKNISQSLSVTILFFSSALSVHSIVWAKNNADERKCTIFEERERFSRKFRLK